MNYHDYLQENGGCYIDCNYYRSENGRVEMIIHRGNVESLRVDGKELAIDGNPFTVDNMVLAATAAGIKLANLEEDEKYNPRYINQFRHKSCFDIFYCRDCPYFNDCDFECFEPDDEEQAESATEW